jgi:hypothetical protein
MTDISGEFGPTVESAPCQHSRFNRVGKDVLQIVYGVSAFTTGVLAVKDLDIAALSGLTTGVSFILERNWPETPRDIAEYLGLVDPVEEMQSPGQQGSDTVE